MPQRVVRHILKHPWRIVVTVMIFAGISWVGTAIALMNSAEASHKADVKLCISMNELRSEIYTAAIDLGASPVIAERFLLETNCEDLP
jgi:hypothetical protein